jgi:hypothetical protein
VKLVLVYPLCDAGLILFCCSDPFFVAVGAALIFSLDLVLVRFLFDRLFFSGLSPKLFSFFGFA